MGKSVNGIGVISGRVGAWVYVPNKGDKKYPQIERAYQPNVYNPKSPAQTLQRSKMNVAGQVSSLCAPEVLSGFGGRKRYNRSKFVSQLLGLAEEINGIVSLNIPDIRFSASRQNPFQVTPSLSASVSNGLSGVLDLSGAKIGDGVRVIAMIIHKSNGQYFYDMVRYADVVKTTESNRLTVEIPLTMTDIAEAATVYCYAFCVPFVLDEAAVSTQYGEIFADHLVGQHDGARIQAIVEELASKGNSVNFGASFCTNENGYVIGQSPAPVPPAPGAPITLTLLANPSGAGTFEVDGEAVAAGTPIECEPDKPVTVIATAANGYEFSRWSDGVYEAEREVSVFENTTLTATFTTA